MTRRGTVVPVSVRAVSGVLPRRDLPGCVLDNLQLSTLMEQVARDIHGETGERIELSNPDFPRDRIGIESRHLLEEGLTTRDMARVAARSALQSSGVDPALVRILLVATVCPDRLVPSSVASMQEELDLGEELVAFDILQGCAGFLTALATAAEILQGMPIPSAALVVGADAMSRVMDAADRSICTIFGDGGGAVVLATGEEQPSERVLGIRSWTTGRGAERNEIRVVADEGRRPYRFFSREGRPCVAPDPLSRVRVLMEGPPLFRDMVGLVPARLRRFLDEMDTSVEEVESFLFHQANRRMLSAICSHPSLRIPDERVPMNLARVGNTSNGSVPLVWSEAGPGRGGRRVLAAFGGGYSMTFLMLGS